MTAERKRYDQLITQFLTDIAILGKEYHYRAAIKTLKEFLAEEEPTPPRRGEGHREPRRGDQP